MIAGQGQPRQIGQDPICKITEAKRAGGMAQACLAKHKALGSKCTIYCQKEKSERN
jgi:hypothetical protein